MNTELMPFPPGTQISWKSTITGQRHAGTVVSHHNGTYQIRTRKGLVIPLHKSRITKECG